MGQPMADHFKPLVEQRQEALSATVALCNLQVPTLGLEAQSNPAVALSPQGQVFHPMAGEHIPEVRTTLPHLILRPRV